jgi:4-hydroxy-tetrahydrodipicolinate synthase
MSDQLRGYFAIANTPFHDDGDIIWADLEKECDLIARSGAHGLVWPVNDSEFTLLCTSERLEGMGRVVDAVGGRMPVVLGVADTSPQGAVELAEGAAKAGGDAVVAMPPWQTKLGTRAQIIAYYRAIADACALPICIQNLSGPMGSALTPDTVAAICEKVDLARYIEEEQVPQGDALNAVIRRRIPGLAVFGGGWCFDMLALHKRGASGNMASSAVPEVHARVWDLMEEGRESEARRIQSALNELLRAKSSTQGLHGVKQLHVMRGTFRSAAVRNAAPRQLDRAYLQELERALDLLAPWLVEV